MAPGARGMVATALFGLTCLILLPQCAGQAPMHLVLNITVSNHVACIPLSGVMNIAVNWGDATAQQFFTGPTTTCGSQSSSGISHAYVNPGVYEIFVSRRAGSSGPIWLEKFGAQLNSGPHPPPGGHGWSISGQYLVAVHSFGDLGLQDIRGCFAHCPNLRVVPSQLPSDVTSLDWVFAESTLAYPNITNWDTSSITSLRYTFYSATSFNEPLDTWQVSNVVDMTGMFYMASSFNRPLNSWDVSRVQSMSFMFYAADAFNGAIDGWDTSSLGDASFMFSYASSFNQPIGQWNVGAVRTFEHMLAYNLNFNQSLCCWDVRQGLSFDSFLFNASSFNRDLSCWCVQHIPTPPSQFSFSCPIIPQYLPRWNEACGPARPECTSGSPTVPSPSIAPIASPLSAAPAAISVPTAISAPTVINAPANAPSRSPTTNAATVPTGSGTAVTSSSATLIVAIAAGMWIWSQSFMEPKVTGLRDYRCRN